jgi:hypothetical protein
MSTAAFAIPGWRREKLQMLRWLAHDGVAGPGVEAMLAAALGDDDWEIRVTAMLAAARLSAEPLAAAVARIALPEQPEDGVTSHERRALLALRDAVLARLGMPRDRPTPKGIAEAVDGDVAGLPPGLDAFVYALTHPLPDMVLAPPEMAAVESGSAGPMLADGSLLAWVPPVPHWLGEAEIRSAWRPNPPRRETPAAGFYIDAEPRGEATLAEAEAAATVVADRLGLPVALPSQTQWEMAARGPDGRRFPWGANARPQARMDLSPWNVAGVTGGPGEWTERPVNSGQGIMVSGTISIVPALSKDRDPAISSRFRFVYRAL